MKINSFLSGILLSVKVAVAGFADGEPVRTSIVHPLERALMECGDDDAVVSVLSERIRRADLVPDGPITDILSRHFGDDFERAQRIASQLPWIMGEPFMRSVHAGYGFSLTFNKPGVLPKYMSAVTTVNGEDLAGTLDLVRNNPGIHVLSLASSVDTCRIYTASLPEQLTEILIRLDNIQESPQAFLQSHVTRFALVMEKNKSPERQRYNRNALLLLSARTDLTKIHLANAQFDRCFFQIFLGLLENNKGLEDVWLYKCTFTDPSQATELAQKIGHLASLKSLRMVALKTDSVKSIFDREFHTYDPTCFLKTFVGHLSTQDRPIGWLDLSYNTLDEETCETLQDIQQRGTVVFALRKDKSISEFSHSLISASRVVRIPNPENLQGRSLVLAKLGHLPPFSSPEPSQRRNMLPSREIAFSTSWI